jgi:competence protein ComEA
VSEAEHSNPVDRLPLPETAVSPGNGARVGRAIVELWHRVRAGEEPVAFGVVVVVLVLLAGLVWFWAGARQGGVQVASAAPNRAAGPPANRGAGEELTSTTAALLAVHVAGAVARPGLYHLPAGSRVADALGQAGGKLPVADVDRLNLAARIVDGQKILVTRRGQPVPAEAVGISGATGMAGSEGTAGPAEPIDLNAADLAALDSLPGIGPATARAILEERTRRGGFRSTRDLLHVPGIGEGRFARLKDRVRV